MAESAPGMPKGLAELAEPTRMSLYRHLQERRPEAVGRDEAAAALGISRALAAFHLDQLVRAGLVEVEYRRLHSRTGPGAGRPSKLYRPVGSELSLSVPPRRYDLAGRILARTVRGVGRSAVKRLEHEARLVGRELGHGGGHAELIAVLAAEGYSPREISPNEIGFRNCPFDALATESADPVCAMNAALIDGLIAGTGADSEGRLEPTPGWCCVRLRRLSPAESAIRVS
jgi:predicted ArsR family transcriptional regulator